MTAGETLRPAALTWGRVPALQSDVSHLDIDGRGRLSLHRLLGPAGRWG